MSSSKLFKYLSAIFVIAFLLPLIAWADGRLPKPETYRSGWSKSKKSLDDPTDLFVTRHFKDFLPPEIWDRMTFDKEKMKQGTLKMLGFTAPELVGKIAPEIKPGKYTYNDLEKFPGLKELFPPLITKHVIKPGGPPFAANIADFEIIPTRQFHYYLPLIEATKKNLGKTNLDKDGYIDQWSWEGGVPFPRPSGEFKPQQVFYNFDRRALVYDKNWGAWEMENRGINRNLKLDKLGMLNFAGIRFKARVLFPPLGWYDERAKRNNEWMAFSYTILEPRANRGMILLRYRYDDPDKMDPAMVYLPQMRRIRKLAGSDTQDPTGDMIYDDQNMLMQKITPKKYPYKFEIIEEREYLMTYSYGSMPNWIDSQNGYVLRDVQFMRRPCYVLKMTQLDPNYIYSKRIYYIDKETFENVYVENYDQKGRLYRTQMMVGKSFIPECGMITTFGSVSISRDYIDKHSTFGTVIAIPAVFERSRFSLQHLIKRGK
jgi:hypothetical protein